MRECYHINPRHTATVVRICDAEWISMKRALNSPNLSLVPIAGWEQKGVRFGHHKETCRDTTPHTAFMIRICDVCPLCGICYALAGTREPLRMQCPQDNGAESGQRCSFISSLSHRKRWDLAMIYHNVG